LPDKTLISRLIIELLSEASKIESRTTYEFGPLALYIYEAALSLELFVEISSLPPLLSRLNTLYDVGKPIEPASKIWCWKLDVAESNSILRIKVLKIGKPPNESITSSHPSLSESP
jgi:hypothetical protein